MTKRRLLLNSVCFSLVLCHSAIADHGFENGTFDGWNIASEPAIVQSVNPHSGIFHATLGVNANSLSDDQLESLMGIPVGTLDSVIVTESFDGAINGSAIAGEFFVEAGETIRFATNFLSGEAENNLFWNDSAFWFVKNSSDEQVVPVTLIANTFHTQGSVSTDYLEFGSFQQETGYFSLEFSPVTSDTYTFVFIVVNDGDGAVNPLLLVDATFDQIETTVEPTSVNPIRGFLSDGQLQDVLASENQHLNYLAGITLNPNEPPVLLEFNGQTPIFEPSSVSLFVESKANTAGLTIEIQLFNFETETFETEFVGAAPTVDLIQEATTSGLPAHFVDDAGAIKARVSWYQSGPVLVFPWTVSIDKLNWKLNQ